MICLFALSLVGCGDSAQTTTPGANPAGADGKVVIQTPKSNKFGKTPIKSGTADKALAEP